MRNFLLILFILLGCKPSNIGLEIINPDLIVFNETKDQNDIPFSEFFDSYRIIPLETNEESIITGIYQVKFLGKKILVLDGGASKIMQFDENGRFIRAIGTIGNGPGEFFKANEIDTDTINGYIFVLDAQSRQVITYDTMGHLVNEFKIEVEIPVESFQYVEKGNFLVQLNPRQNDTGPVLVLVNSKGKILKTMLKNKAAYSATYFVPGPFVKTTSGIKFAANYMDLIYEYKEDELVPIIKVNPSNALNLEKIVDLQVKIGRSEQDAKGNRINMLTAYNGMWGIRGLWETEKYIGFHYSVGLRIVPVLVDKVTRIARRGGLRDNLFSGYTFHEFIHTNPSFFIKGFVPGRRMDKIAQFKIIADSINTISSVDDSIKERVINLSAQSNPVLIFYNVK